VVRSCGQAALHGNSTASSLVQGQNRLQALYNALVLGVTVPGSGPHIYEFACAHRPTCTLPKPGALYGS